MANEVSKQSKKNVEISKDKIGDKKDLSFVFIHPLNVQCKIRHQYLPSTLTASVFRKRIVMVSVLKCKYSGLALVCSFLSLIVLYLKANT